MSEVREFYVGYLKTPAGLARFLRWIVLISLGAVLGFGLLSAKSQNDPGGGVWHGEDQGFVGLISATPYPLLRVMSDHPGRPVETILLVSEGKRGGGERVTRMDGRMARMHGTILERDGRRLLELAESNAISAIESNASVDASRLGAKNIASLGSAVLRGEIIDPKCYSGAMKPGEGKTHKECATLCIAGGIPPMFVTIDAAGARQYYLLTDVHGRALDSRILPYVADLVEISGMLEKQDDLLVLKIDPASIRRL